MRVFAFALPTPDKSARKIFGAAFSPKWGDKSGIFISDPKILTLPPALADGGFQQELLRKCRERASPGVSQRQRDDTVPKEHAMRS